MKKILIVDDETKITDGLIELFESHEYAASGRYDRESAEELIASEFFPIILADLRLKSEADGMALLDAIRATSPESKVLTLTGHASNETEAEVLGRGASMMLRKPLPFETVLAAVESLPTEEPAVAADELDGESVDVEELHHKLRNVLFSIPLRRYGMSSEEAEELVQEAWVLFLEKRREIRKARPWLTGTVANLCKQEIQRNRRNRAMSTDLDEGSFEVPDERARVNPDTLAVRQVLGRADERTRNLCTMIGMEGLSYDEVSAELEMPLGSVGPLYIRAKQRLRRQLEERI
jgi:RNA polymerase sigma factor (sigma-70 family)